MSQLINANIHQWCLLVPSLKNGLIDFFFLMFIIVHIRFILKRKKKLENSGKTETFLRNNYILFSNLK